MKYDRGKPEDYLYSLKRKGVKLGLDKIREFLSSLGDPQKDFDSVIVGGTNGKGSVCNMVSNVLHEVGYDTGMYISPHLAYFEERISVNGEWIGQDELWDLIDVVNPVLESIENKDVKKRPSFFEVLTAIAFLYFSKRGVDVAVLEVGMGGRLDATNVTEHIASVITTVGLDHMEHLGETKEKIAFEKAGIIHRGDHFVTGEKDEKITDYFMSICEERNAEYSHSLEREYDILKEPLRLKMPEYGEFTVPGTSRWQAENALTAIMTLERLGTSGYNISKENIKTGLSKTNLPGRLDTISINPWIVIDSAHNVPGIKALMDSLDEMDYNRLLLVMGVLEDKDYKGMAELLKSKCDLVFAGEPVSDRSLDSRLLAQEFKDCCKISTYKEGYKALEAAIKRWEPGDLILVTGSIYFLGDIVRKWEEVLK